MTSTTPNPHGIEAKRSTKGISIIGLAKVAIRHDVHYGTTQTFQLPPFPTLASDDHYRVDRVLLQGTLHRTVQSGSNISHIRYVQGQIEKTYTRTDPSHPHFKTPRTRRTLGTPQTARERNAFLLGFGSSLSPSLPSGSVDECGKQACFCVIGPVE